MLGYITAGIAIAIALFIGIELNTLYVPKNFERPWQYKFFCIIYKILAITAQIGGKLGLGNEPTILRNLIEKTASYFPHEDENVKMEDTKVSNIRVRIYKPKSIKRDDKLPIMVFYHGGGYAFGSLSSYDYYLFEIVKQINMIIISVDYRMAPENPYPTPTNDCFDVAKYVIEHPTEFNADVTKLVLAGDSAGGNAAIVVSTRMAKENFAIKPKIQVLIYPWVQMFFTKLPLHIRYAEKTFKGETKTKLSTYASWYLGITNITRDLINIYRKDEHLAMFDQKEQKRILSLLDATKIPDKYKLYKSDYESLEYHIPSRVPENSLLKRDPKVAELIRKLFDPKLSPLLASNDDLTILPKTYFQVLGWDSIKDDILLYAERLREAHVDTYVDFYENGFHGICFMTHGSSSYQIARDMQKDLIKYLRNNL